MIYRLSNESRSGKYRKSSCEGKKKYDKKGAITAAKRARFKGRQKWMRVYSCGDHWHIAHARILNKKFAD